MRNILIIMKKELRRFFTDRRMLVALFLPGIILYFVYSLMGNFIGGAFTAEEDYTYKIGITTKNEKVYSAIDGLGEKTKIVRFDFLEEGKKAFENGEIDIIIDEVMQKEGKDCFIIIFNSTSPESTAIYASVYQALSAPSMNVTYNYYVSAEDTATEEDISKMMLNMLLPMLTMVFLFTGCMAVAPESIAGEKERGTMATLLITPIKRSHVALGKVFALSITALASAIMSFLAVVASIPKLMSGASGMDMSVSLDIGVVEYLGLFVVIVLTVILFTVILSIISTVAKSVKEATSYATPVMVLVMIVGIMSFVTDGAPATPLYLIPVYNSVACISSIFGMAFNPLGLLLFALSNVVVIALGIFVLAKMFSNENVMFNK